MMYDVRREPHARVVVHVAAVDETAHEAVDADVARLAAHDILRQFRCVRRRCVAGRVRFEILPDAVAELGVDAPPVVSPCQFEDELRRCGGAGPADRGIAHLREIEHAVA